MRALSTWFYTLGPPLKGMMTEKANGNGNGLADISRSALPLPLLLGLLGLLGTGFGGYSALTARQERTEVSLDYESKIDDIRQAANKEIAGLRIELTKEQIENSGLRNSLLLMTQTCSSPQRTGGR